MSKSELGEFLDDLAKGAKDVGAEVKSEFSKTSKNVSTQLRKTAKAVENDLTEVGAVAKKELSEAKKVAEENLRIVAEDIDIVGKKAKAKVGDALDTAKDISKNVDDIAGQAAIKGEELYKKGEEIYEKVNVKDITIGAGLGAKAGFLASRFMPLAVKPLTVGGAIVGGIAGQKGVKKITKWKDEKYAGWLNRHKSKKKNRTPS